MMMLAVVIPTTPGLVEVVISENKCFGAKDTDPGMSYNKVVHDIDAEQSEWTALCNSFKSTSVQKLGFADIGLGPIGMKTLAETIPTIPGVVEVVISGNKCFGVKQVRNPNTCAVDDVHDIDSDQNGWIALCEAMKDSSIQKLGFADIGMGPVGMKTLAKTIPTIPGLVEVVISRNKICAD
eukprot:SAG11_NODE_16646_length_541_cov_1.325792_1_plen_180_part_11